LVFQKVWQEKLSVKKPVQLHDFEQNWSMSVFLRGPPEMQYENGKPKLD